MAKIGRFIRYWARLIAGLAFWLHAILFLTVSVPSFQTFANRIGLSVSEMLLGLFFLTMAVLNGYGFWKFSLDLLYIYFFPFIFAYMAGVAAFKMATRIPGYASRFFPKIRPAFTWKAMLRELVADDSAYLSLTNVTSTSPTSAPVIVAQTTEPKAEKKRPLWSRLALPFRSFTIAWCVLIVVTDKPVISFLGLLILSVHLMRFIVNLAQLLAGARQYLMNAEVKAMNYATNLLNTVMNASDEALENQDVLRAVTLLALFRGSAFLLLNRSEISYAFFLLGCLVYIAVYMRIAILFGFMYLGIAKLNHLQLGFADAMVNSFAMPLSYTNFPRQWIMQMAQDVHSVVVILLGIGAFATYIYQKLDALRNVAGALWEKLDSADVRSRMATAAKKNASNKKTPEPGQAPIS
jgi:hypothetical protein